MHNLALVSRVNVLTAMRDHDQQGAGPFLEGLGFEGPNAEVLVERGRRYDARALLAYAHGKATGEYLVPEQISLIALDVLTGLGFTVAFREELDRPKSAPATRTRVPGTAAPRATRVAAVKPPSARSRPEPEVKLCPSCFTQLSMMGSCDYCE